MRVDAPTTPLGRQWTAADAPAKAPSDANAAAAGNVAPALASGVAASQNAGGQSGGAGQQDGRADNTRAYLAQQAASPPAAIVAGAGEPTLQDVRAYNHLIDRVLEDLASIGCQLSTPGAGQAQGVDSPAGHVDLLA